MKKNLIIGTILALGTLSMSTLTASAADTHGKCADGLAIQKFHRDTDPLASALKAKNLELRSLYGYDSIDIHKVDAVEAEIKELKYQINAFATKLNIPPCGRS